MIYLSIHLFIQYLSISFIQDEAGTDSPDVSLGKDISSVEKQLQFQSAEIAKMSTIHDQLMDRERCIISFQINIFASPRSPMSDCLWLANPGKYVDNV